MGLAHPSLAEDKQGVEGLLLGVLGDGLANAYSKLVARAATIVLKGVSWIQLRINVLKALVTLKGVSDTRLAYLKVLFEL